MNESDEQAFDDELALQRFASGELTAEQENALLLDCEIHPDRWRGLVLAMVEHRRVERALSGWSEVGAPVSAPGRRAAHPAWFAIAACLGLAVGFGFGRSPAVPVGEADSAAATPAARSLSDRYVVLDETVTAELANAYRPLFDPAALEVIRRHGYRVEEQPRLYFVGADGDGSPIAVPSRNVKLTYVGE